MENYSVGITGVGSYVPEKVIDNFYLSNIVDTSDEWIVERTGIRERRIVEDNMATSDLCTRAAKRAIEDANIDPNDIDLIIVATITPDHGFPSTACIVQKNIEANRAAAFDLNAGCTGFVYAMATAESFIKANIYKNILIIGGETLSKIVNWEDRNTCILFGDGAGACILSRCENGYGIINRQLGSNGKDGNVLIQEGGGSRLPVDQRVLDEKLNTLKMDGKEVFKFAVKTMEKSTREIMEGARLGVEDIDLIIPHQANTRIIDSSRKRLNLSEEKIFVNLNKYGNMSAASVPVALDEALREGRIKKGDNIVFVAFGAGLTWGSILLKWNKEEVNV